MIDLGAWASETYRVPVRGDVGDVPPLSDADKIPYE